jgi:site-specific recombinase XerD
MPNNVINILNASCTDSTWKQYSISIKKWITFCQQSGIKPQAPSIQEILKFLASLYESNMSYMSINSARSALSTYLGRIDENIIGENVLIKRFMKGVWRLRPPNPKYNVTWDVNLVFELFKLWPESSSLPLQPLSYKLVSLIALTTGQRVQSLIKIKLENIIWSDPVQIVIKDCLKTTSFSKPNPVLQLPSYSKDLKLCVIDTLRCYVSKTESIRSCNQLLIQTNKPHGPVCTQTVSNWMRRVLHEAGIDTNVFSAHSFRHASTSAAANKGLGVDSILKCVGWSKSSKVFARHYNRPIQQVCEFGNTVLSTAN